MGYRRGLQEARRAIRAEGQNPKKKSFPPTGRHAASALRSARPWTSTRCSTNSASPVKPSPWGWQKKGVLMRGTQETAAASERGTGEVPMRGRKQQLPDAYQYRACVPPDPLGRLRHGHIVPPRIKGRQGDRPPTPPAGLLARSGR